MRIKFTRTVAFAECDMSWQIRLCDLENYLLMASDDGVSRAGLSPAYLRERYNANWVLLRLSLQMQSLPHYKDTLVIETWESKLLRCMVVREYRLFISRDGVETEIGQGTSILVGHAHGDARDMFAGVCRPHGQNRGRARTFVSFRPSPRADKRPNGGLAAPYPLHRP